MKINQIPNKIGMFLREVKIEIKRVNWPTFKETIRYTLIVIFICFLVAIFLGGLDWIYTILLEKIIF
jgi:preprotein translocase subunit SecE